MKIGRIEDVTPSPPTLPERRVVVVVVVSKHLCMFSCLNFSKSYCSIESLLFLLEASLFIKLQARVNKFLCSLH